jgi:hypothetical protein
MLRLNIKDINLYSPRMLNTDGDIAYANIQGVTTKVILTPFAVQYLYKVAAAQNKNTDKLDLCANTNVNVTYGRHNELQGFYRVGDLYNTYQAARLARKANNDYSKHRATSIDALHNDTNHVLYSLAKSVIESKEFLNGRVLDTEAYNFAQAVLEEIH